MEGLKMTPYRHISALVMQSDKLDLLWRSWRNRHFSGTANKLSEYTPFQRLFSIPRSHIATAGLVALPHHIKMEETEIVLLSCTEDYLKGIKKIKIGMRSLSLKA